MADAISADLLERLPGQRKTQRDKLAPLVATMLDVRSANLMDLAASLPRPAEQLAMRNQSMKGLLANKLGDRDAVTAPLGREMLERISARGGPLLLMIDRTQATELHEAVMVAVRVGGRALPLAWRVEETQGTIAFAEQHQALEAAVARLPDGVRLVRMGDRFYRSPNLIARCRAQGWHWRLRLKQDLLVFEDGGELTLAACFARGQHMLTGIELTAKRVRTGVAMVHQEGHPEPWIIVLFEAPNTHRAFNYGLRWGREVIVPDFKTRGFGIEDSHIRIPTRLHHLILVMALALYWAVSTGMCDAVNKPTTLEKNQRGRRRNYAKALTSFFTRGIRRIRLCLQRLRPHPPLWSAWTN